MTRFSSGGAVVVALSVALCLGCLATVGPLDRADFLDLVQRSVDLRGEPILLAQRGEWYIGPDLVVPGTFQPRREGVVVVQETRLLFLTWDSDAERYEMALAVAYGDLNTLEHRWFPLNSWIVMETANQATEAVTLTNPWGHRVDRAAVTRALVLIRQRVGPSVR
jgi:hypothetical protein